MGLEMRIYYHLYATCIIFMRLVDLGVKMFNFLSSINSTSGTAISNIEHFDHWQSYVKSKTDVFFRTLRTTY